LCLLSKHNDCHKDFHYNEVTGCVWS